MDEKLLREGLKDLDIGFKASGKCAKICVKLMDEIKAIENVGTKLGVINSVINHLVEMREGIKEQFEKEKGNVCDGKIRR